MKAWRREALAAGVRRAEELDDATPGGVSTEKWLSIIAEVANQHAAQAGRPGADLDEADAAEYLEEHGGDHGFTVTSSG